MTKFEFLVFPLLRLRHENLDLFESIYLQQKRRTKQMRALRAKLETPETCNHVDNIEFSIFIFSQITYNISQLWDWKLRTKLYCTSTQPIVESSGMKTNHKRSQSANWKSQKKRFAPNVFELNKSEKLFLIIFITFHCVSFEKHQLRRSQRAGSWNFLSSRKNIIFITNQNHCWSEQVDRK